MAKLYLLGGENVSCRSAKEVNEAAFHDVGVPAEVLVFSWAHASFDQKYRKRKMITDYLQSLGACSVDYVDYAESTEAIGQKLQRYRLVYLTGGIPSVLLERLKIKGVDKMLCSYDGVIVGRSAGALVLCKKCVATVRNTSRVKILDGLGLANLTLKAHYVTKDDLVLERFSLQERIFALPKDSALIYDNGKLSSMGRVYLFNGGKRQVLGEESFNVDF